jgi:hypothetical protein
MARDARVDAFVQRFRDLDYKSVKAWPIYESGQGQRVMYHMIHTTDHPQGPKLMRRAHAQAVRSPSTDAAQLKLLEVKRQNGK